MWTCMHGADTVTFDHRPSQSAVRHRRPSGVLDNNLERPYPQHRIDHYGVGGVRCFIQK